MKDVAAVAPLLLVAAVFVGVCITALRATDWRLRVDKRPATTTAPVVDVAAGDHAADDADAARPAAAAASAPQDEPADPAERAVAAEQPDAPRGTGGRHRAHPES